MSALQRIRHQVFVVEQQIPVDADRGGLDAESFHVIALLGKEIVGTGRLTAEEDGKGLLFRIGVLKKVRGKGLAKRIIKELETIAMQHSLNFLYLDPHDHLQPFYESLGYIKEESWSRTVAEHELIRMYKKL